MKFKCFKCADAPAAMLNPWVVRDYCGHLYWFFPNWEMAINFAIKSCKS